MGVIVRGNMLSIRYKDSDGKWVTMATGLRIDEREKAERLYENVKHRIQCGEDLGDLVVGSVKVGRYSKGWIRERHERVPGSVTDDEIRLNLHILPELGQMLFEEVRPRHVRRLVRKLRKGPLAPRTIRHVYATFRRMCNDAVVDEVIERSPCILKKHDLPPNQDKDPTWRDTAVFSVVEVETLISDSRIPLHRRVRYAMLALAGPRSGGGSARRWRDYDSTAKPLGKLGITTKYSTSRKREEPATKSGVVRYLPVHPTLVKILREWKLKGWPEYMGRAPGPNDLIIPDEHGGFLPAYRIRAELHDDLDTLGLRRRRTHDLRRSFVSIGRAHGVRKDVMEWMSHGPRGDIVDMYTTLPWELLCEEIVKIRVELREGKVVQLSKAATAGSAESSGEATAPPEEDVVARHILVTADESTEHQGGKVAEAHGNRTRQGRFSRPSSVLKTEGSTSHPRASPRHL